MNNKVKGILIVIICLLVLGGIGFGVYKYMDGRDNNKKPDSPANRGKEPVEYKETDYNVKLIKTVNSTQEGNYLISPYSIEIALNMLRDGANGNTKEQIDNVIGKREIPVFSVKDRISVTNGAFIKDSVKDLVNDSYYDKLKEYDAELVYDPFKTPDKINDWVKDKTYGMIPYILEDISPDFVMGIANAVAIDVKWESPFECQNTKAVDFNISDSKKMKTQMMHASYDGGDTKYFENDNAKGIILPYEAYDKNGLSEYDSNEDEFTQLEFIGILPNGKVDEYVENLTEDSLTSIDKNVTTTKEATIDVSLPRFSYSFDLKGFMGVLEAMGIKDVFDPDAADLTNIFSKESIAKMGASNVYVSTAIHKTYIDLNEKGTKAAAVTYFGIDKNAAMPERKKQVKIEFNKPFVYMIRDSKTKEILFFGVVKEPNKWEGSTCSNVD